VTAKMAPGPHALLRKRYESQKGAWAYFEEVRNQTGYQRTRTTYADAVALSLWPSRGIELHGHEIKVSRSDLLKELQEPGKSEPIQQFCDRWWLVLGAANLIKPGELPPTWGLMVVQGSQLRVTVEAPKLERKPWSPEFVASFCRSIDDGINRTHVSRAEYKLVTDRVSALEADVDKRVAERLAEEVARKAPDLEALRRSVDAFEAAIGRPLTTYNGRQLAELVRVAEVMAGLGPHQVDHLVARLESALEATRGAAAALRDATQVPT
jgi:hypothetical protein